VWNGRRNSSPFIIIFLPKSTLPLLPTAHLPLFVILSLSTLPLFLLPFNHSAETSHNSYRLYYLISLPLVAAITVIAHSARPNPDVARSLLPLPSLLPLLLVSHHHVAFARPSSEVVARSHCPMIFLIIISIHRFVILVAAWLAAKVYMLFFCGYVVSLSVG